MEEKDIEVGGNVLNLSHPCICNTRFIYTISRGLLHREMNITLVVSFSVTRFLTFVKGSPASNHSSEEADLKDVFESN